MMPLKVVAAAFCMYLCHKPLQVTANVGNLKYWNMLEVQDSNRFQQIPVVNLEQERSLVAQSASKSECVSSASTARLGPFIPKQKLNLAFDIFRAIRVHSNPSSTGLDYWILLTIHVCKSCVLFLCSVVPTFKPPSSRTPNIQDSVAKHSMLALGWPMDRDKSTMCHGQPYASTMSDHFPPIGSDGCTATGRTKGSLGSCVASTLHVALGLAAD